MSQKTACEDCRFFERGLEGAICRRLPPVPFLSNGPAGNLVTINVWRNVQPDDWCGEWSSKIVWKGEFQ